MKNKRTNSTERRTYETNTYIQHVICNAPKYKADETAAVRVIARAYEVAGIAFMLLVFGLAGQFGSCCIQAAHFSPSAVRAGPAAPYPYTAAIKNPWTSVIAGGYGPIVTVGCHSICGRRGRAHLACGARCRGAAGVG